MGSQTKPAWYSDPQIMGGTPVARARSRVTLDQRVEYARAPASVAGRGAPGSPRLSRIDRSTMS